jgi:hypothetical protein
MKKYSLYRYMKVAKNIRCQFGNFFCPGGKAVFAPLAVMRANSEKAQKRCGIRGMEKILGQPCFTDEHELCQRPARGAALGGEG